MEVAFHSNKCALKDSLRLIRIAKNPCWKRKSILLQYSEHLISTNKNIISLYAGISEEALNEFVKLEEQFVNLANTVVSENDKCPICEKDCLAVPEDPSTEKALPDKKPLPYYEEETEQTRTEKIEKVAEAMKRLATKTEYIESVISMHKEELDKVEYTNSSAVEYSEAHIQQIERTIERKKRALFIKKWISGVIVFFCFVSLLLLRPFIY